MVILDDSYKLGRKQTSMILMQCNPKVYSPRVGPKGLALGRFPRYQKEEEETLLKAPNVQLS
jgi:hypothetical protein